MCLAIPAKIIELNQMDNSALVDLSGVKKSISMMLIEEANEGDYVLVHVGFALKVISPEEAQKTLALFERAGQMLS